MSSIGCRWSGTCFLLTGTAFSPSVLFPALPGPRFALISIEALVPSLLRYPGIGPGAQYTPDTLRRWFVNFFQSPVLLSLGCCGFCLSLRLSCCCSACPLPFRLGLLGWGVPLLPCASDCRLAGCISSGLPVAIFALCLFLVSVSPFRRLSFFVLFVAAVLFFPPLCLLVGLCLVSSVAYPLPFCPLLFWWFVTWPLSISSL